MSTSTIPTASPGCDIHYAFNLIAHSLALKLGAWMPWSRLLNHSLDTSLTDTQQQQLFRYCISHPGIASRFEHASEVTPRLDAACVTPGTWDNYVAAQPALRARHALCAQVLGTDLGPLSALPTFASDVHVLCPAWPDTLARLAKITAMVADAAWHSEGVPGSEVSKATNLTSKDAAACIDVLVHARLLRRQADGRTHSAVTVQLESRAAPSAYEGPLPQPLVDAILMILHGSSDTWFTMQQLAAQTRLPGLLLERYLFTYGPALTGVMMLLQHGTLYVRSYGWTIPKEPDFRALQGCRRPAASAAPPASQQQSAAALQAMLHTGAPPDAPVRNRHSASALKRRLGRFQAPCTPARVAVAAARHTASIPDAYTNEATPIPVPWSGLPSEDRAVLRAASLCGAHLQLHRNWAGQVLRLAALALQAGVTANDIMWNLRLTSRQQTRAWRDLRAMRQLGLAESVVPQSTVRHLLLHQGFQECDNRATIMLAAGAGPQAEAELARAQQACQAWLGIPAHTLEQARLRSAEACDEHSAASVYLKWLQVPSGPTQLTIRVRSTARLTDIERIRRGPRIAAVEDAPGASSLVDAASWHSSADSEGETDDDGAADDETESTRSDSSGDDSDQLIDTVAISTLTGIPALAKCLHKALQSVAQVYAKRWFTLLLQEAAAFLKSDASMSGFRASDASAAFNQCLQAHDLVTMCLLRSNTRSRRGHVMVTAAGTDTSTRQFSAQLRAASQYPHFLALDRLLTADITAPALASLAHLVLLGLLPAAVVEPADQIAGQHIAQAAYSAPSIRTALTQHTQDGVETLPTSDVDASDAQGEQDEQEDALQGIDDEASQQAMSFGTHIVDLYNQGLAELGHLPDEADQFVDPAVDPNADLCVVLRHAFNVLPVLASRHAADTGKAAAGNKWFRAAVAHEYLLSLALSCAGAADRLPAAGFVFTLDALFQRIPALVLWQICDIPMHRDPKSRLSFKSLRTELRAKAAVEPHACIDMGDFRGVHRLILHRFMPVLKLLMVIGVVVSDTTPDNSVFYRLLPCIDMAHCTEEAPVYDGGAPAECPGKSAQPQVHAPVLDCSTPAAVIEAWRALTTVSEMSREVQRNLSYSVPLLARTKQEMQDVYCGETEPGPSSVAWKALPCTLHAYIYQVLCLCQGQLAEPRGHAALEWQALDSGPALCLESELASTAASLEAGDDEHAGVWTLPGVACASDWMLVAAGMPWPDFHRHVVMPFRHGPASSQRLRAGTTIQACYPLPVLSISVFRGYTRMLTTVPNEYRLDTSEVLLPLERRYAPPLPLAFRTPMQIRSDAIAHSVVIQRAFRTYMFALRLFDAPTVVPQVLQVQQACLPRLPGYDVQPVQFWQATPEELCSSLATAGPSPARSPRRASSAAAGRHNAAPATAIALSRSLPRFDTSRYRGTHLMGLTRYDVSMALVRVGVLPSSLVLQAAKLASLTMRWNAQQFASCVSARAKQVHAALLEGERAAHPELGALPGAALTVLASAVVPRSSLLWRTLQHSPATMDAATLRFGATAAELVQTLAHSARFSEQWYSLPVALRRPLAASPAVVEAGRWRAQYLHAELFHVLAPLRAAALHEQDPASIAALSARFPSQLVSSAIARMHRTGLLLSRGALQAHRLAIRCVTVPAQVLLSRLECLLEGMAHVVLQHEAWPVPSIERWAATNAGTCEQQALVPLPVPASVADTALVECPQARAADMVSLLSLKLAMHRASELCGIDPMVALGGAADMFAPQLLTSLPSWEMATNITQLSAWRAGGGRWSAISPRAGRSLVSVEERVTLANRDPSRGALGDGEDAAQHSDDDGDQFDCRSPSSDGEDSGSEDRGAAAGSPGRERANMWTTVPGSKLSEIAYLRSSVLAWKHQSETMGLPPAVDPHGQMPNTIRRAGAAGFLQLLDGDAVVRMLDADAQHAQVTPLPEHRWAAWTQQRADCKAAWQFRACAAQHMQPSATAGTLLAAQYACVQVDEPSNGQAASSWSESGAAVWAAAAQALVPATQQALSSGVALGILPAMAVVADSVLQATGQLPCIAELRAEAQAVAGGTMPLAACERLWTVTGLCLDWCVAQAAAVYVPAEWGASWAAPSSVLGTKWKQPADVQALASLLPGNAPWITPYIAPVSAPAPAEAPASPRVRGARSGQKRRRARASLAAAPAPEPSPSTTVAESGTLPEVKDGMWWAMFLSLASVVVQLPGIAVVELAARNAAVLSLADTMTLLRTGEALGLWAVIAQDSSLVSPALCSECYPGAGVQFCEQWLVWPVKDVLPRLACWLQECDPDLSGILSSS